MSIMGFQITDNYNVWANLAFHGSCFIRQCFVELSLFVAIDHSISFHDQMMQHIFQKNGIKFG